MKWPSELIGSYTASGLVHLMVLVAAHSWWNSAPQVWPARAGVNATAAVAAQEFVVVEEAIEVEETPLIAPVAITAGSPSTTQAAEVLDSPGSWEPAQAPPQGVRQNVAALVEAVSLSQEPHAVRALEMVRSETGGQTGPSQIESPPRVITRSGANPPPSTESRVSLESMFSAGELRKSMPQPLYNPPPEYPPALLAVGREGVVVVRVRITATGTVADCRIERSSGEPAFDEAALNAVREWRFEPAIRFGTAVPTEILYPIRFQYLAAP